MENKDSNQFAKQNNNTLHNENNSQHISSDSNAQHKHSESTPNNNQTFQPPVQLPNNKGNILKIIGCLGFILLSLILLGFLIYQAVSMILNSVDISKDDTKTEIINSNKNSSNIDKDDKISKTETKSDEEMTTEENDKNDQTPRGNGKTITLNEGIYRVGDNIQPGRYIVGSKNRGNLFINDGKRAFNINEIIGTGDEDVIVQIEDGQKIEIKTSNDVHFKPVKDKIYEGEISAGIYEVGKHIEPGTYKFTALNEGYTLINTFEKVADDYQSKKIESINNKDKKVTQVELNEGEILNIQNAIKVKIEKQ